MGVLTQQCMGIYWESVVGRSELVFGENPTTGF
jgi:hypothetical protein